MIKRLVVLLNFVLISTFCIAQVNRDSVLYKNLNSCLILYNDSTFIFKNTGFDIAPIHGFGDDTISYGKYIQYKNKSLYLYSDPYIMSSQLNITVQEEKIKQQDSITIILSSPYGGQCKNYLSILKDAYFYLIDLSYTDIATGKESNYKKCFFNDTIIIPDFSKKLIAKISIMIYPYKSIGLGTPYYKYLSANYTPKNNKSNYFSLYISQFTASYIYYERFYAKEIEIIDNCTIAIDKKTLLSKCMGEKFNDEWDFIIFKRKNPYGTDEIGNITED